MRKFDIRKKLKSKTNDQEIDTLSINKNLIANVSIAILLMVIITLMFPRGKSFQFADLSEGSVFTGPEIIAPFTFAVNKSDEEYNRDVEAAKNKVPPIFVRQDSVANSQLEKVQQFYANLEKEITAAEVSEDKLSSFFQNQNIVMSNDDISYLIKKFSSGATQGRTSSIQNRTKSLALAFEDSLTTRALKIAEEVFSAGILDREKQSLGEIKAVSVIHDNQEVIEDLSYLYGPVDVKHTLLEKLRAEEKSSEQLVRINYKILEAFLTPTIFYDSEDTQKRKEDVISNVPLAKDQVLEGERIIDSHERITQSHIDKLRSLALAKADRGEQSEGISSITPFLGKFFLVTVVLLMVVIYVYRNRSLTLNNHKEMILISLIFLIISFLTFLVNRFALSGFLIPIVIGSMLLTIFFDSKLGFVGTVALSILVGAMRGNEYGITVLGLIAGSVAILTVTRVRSRNWLLYSIAYLVSVYLLSITVLDFLRYTSFSKMLLDWGFGAINGCLSPIFTYGLIVVIEFSFDITTDMTLLELSDLNQPLLRQLAMRCPGTYHHSIVVGNLAESAAEEISANSLLARVGAYYHDIGKMEKPDYFVENQQKGRNPQEKLNPTMSSLILVNHVRRGLELSKQHGLPKEIEAFISEHHGTSLISYFYQKALEVSDNGEVSEANFRYPGPKPETKETAIVMLADAVEAASRTLKDPSVSRIKGMVNKIVYDRFHSGELDNSPLTLRDLNKICEAFQKILFGIFHGRIEYPDPDKQEKKETTTAEQRITNAKS